MTYCFSDERAKFDHLVCNKKLHIFLFKIFVHDKRELLVISALEKKDELQFF